MQIADLAIGRWPGILASFGLDARTLSGKHCPCPVCNGRDRFRFDNQEGRGTFFCSHCGAGDGFDLLRQIKGWSFKDAANQVRQIVGTIQAGPIRRSVSDDEKLAQCKRIWDESRAVSPGDAVGAYLQQRTGIIDVPASLRFHPALTYRHDNGTLTKHPAMLARVTDATGSGCAIHRTYLTPDGRKADVPTAKKILGTLPESSAVRLCSHNSVMGIAEGIETALSASARFAVPVWSSISAVGLERWTPPPGVVRVMVFGDNDLSATGQAASWALAKRLIAEGISTEVHIPETPGQDWCDVRQKGVS